MRLRLLIAAGATIAILVMGIVIWLLCSPTDVDPKLGFGATTPDEYMARAAAHLRAFAPGIRTRVAPAQETGRQRYVPSAYPKVERRVEFEVNGAALIPFDDGGWVYVIEHSMHDDQSGYDRETNTEILRSRIGDVVMCVDSNGKIYHVTPPTHPCPMIFLTPPNGRSFRGSREFIASPIVGGPGTANWVEYSE